VSLTVNLQAARLIRAEPHQVWQAFCRLTAWPAVHASIHPSLERPRIDGTRKGLDLRLKPLNLPMLVKARVTESLPARRAAWQARWLGISSRHRFAFKGVAGGTMVESQETLSGWTLLLIRPIYSPRRLSQLSQKWLKDLAAEAELRPPPA
jgi:hypothetical protein